MKITVEKKDDKVCVNVTLTPRLRDEDLQYVDTATVKRYLEQQNYDMEHHLLLKAPAKPVHNSLGTYRLSGEWIFIDKHYCAPPPETTVNKVEKVLENKKNINDNKKSMHKKITRKKRQTKSI